MTHYATLGVHAKCSEDELKDAYRTLMRELHPDRNGGQESAECTAVNVAYGVLSDPKAVVAYRRELEFTCVRCVACSGEGVTYRTGRGFKQVMKRCAVCDGAGYVPIKTTRRKK